MDGSCATTACTWATNCCNTGADRTVRSADSVADTCVTVGTNGRGAAGGMETGEGAGAVGADVPGGGAGVGVINTPAEVAGVGAGYTTPVGEITGAD